MRVPDILLSRIDHAAGEGERSKWILDACRMRLDGSVGEAATPSVSKTESAGSSPAAPAIDPHWSHDVTESTIWSSSEVPICGKDWWEDGEQYECLMDKGHKNLKHGQSGMVRRLEN